MGEFTLIVVTQSVQSVLLSAHAELHPAVLLLFLPAHRQDFAHISVFTYVLLYLVTAEHLRESPLCHPSQSVKNRVSSLAPALSVPSNWRSRRAWSFFFCPLSRSHVMCDSSLVSLIEYN